MNSRSTVVVLCAALVGSTAGAAPTDDTFVQGVAGSLSALEASQDDGARRQELVTSVVAAREKASGRTFSPRLRASLASRLSQVDLGALEAFAASGGLGSLDSFVPNVIGEAAKDLVFTPVTPCRIVNTTVAGGVIAGNTARSFYVNGNTAGAFEGQGGNAGGCGIPDAATAVEMNFISVAPGGAGDFRAYPFGIATPPLASVINYATLPGLNIANGVATPVCNPATATCTFDLTVQADVAPSHLIIDVVGYYAPPASGITVLRYNGSNSDATVSTAEELFRAVGNFTKVAPGSTITTTWNAHVQTVGTVGTSFCHYQVRIDGLVPAGSGASEPGVVNYGDHQGVSWTDHWTGLTAGTHAVAIYVRGNATSCGANFGNFQQTVVIREE